MFGIQISIKYQVVLAEINVAEQLNGMSEAFLAMSLQGKGQVLYFFILFANRNQSLPLLLEFYRAAFYSTSYN